MSDFSYTQGMTTVFFIEPQDTGRFRFSCFDGLTGDVEHFDGFTDQLTAAHEMARHLEVCERCSLYPPTVERELDTDQGIGVPSDLIGLILTEDEILKGEHSMIQVLEPDELISRALIAAAFVGAFAPIAVSDSNKDRESSFEKLFYQLSLLAESAKSASRSVCWASAGKA